MIELLIVLILISPSIVTLIFAIISARKMKDKYDATGQYSYKKETDANTTQQ